VASDVTSGNASELARPDAAPVDRPQPQPAPPAAQPHRDRFLVIYVLLGLALLAAIAGVVVFAGRSINPGPSWSSWKPSGGGIGAAKQIAERVSGTYHLPGGKQLVDVIAKAPSFSSGTNTVPVSFIAVRGAKGKIDEVQDVSASNSVWYSLCGLGAACSIATGTPSVSRGTLVRREILELALYTFKYVKGVKHVVAFMPPPKGLQPQNVVYLQKSDVEAQLKNPLRVTLAPKVPLPATISAREQRTIAGSTATRLYKFGLSQTQQGDAVLVLAPLPA
jgi:hypothetical protein